VALRRPNLALWAVLGFASLLLAITLTIPPVMLLFNFGHLHIYDVVAIFAVAAATVFILELLKATSNLAAEPRMASGRLD
jgi:P-type Ca2+ transporter type 2C